MPDRTKIVKKMHGRDIEVYEDTGEATMGGVRTYFGPGADGKPISAPEIMALKKNRETQEDLDDWKQISTGIGNGTLTY
jgi:hypothetical protein